MTESNSRDLEKHLKAAREVLPSEVVASGLVRLADLVARSGLGHANPRATIYRLERAGLAKPSASSRAGKRARVYTFDDAVNLLFACNVMRALDVTPREATRLVKSHRVRQGEFAGTQLLEALAKATLSQFESHTLGRLLGTVVSILNGGQPLQTGTIVFVDESSDETKGLNDELWAKHLLKKSRWRSVALVGDANDIVFLPALTDAALHGRRYRELLSPSPLASHRIVVAEFATVGDNETRPTTNDVSDERQLLAIRLLDAIGPGYLIFCEHVLTQIPRDAALTDAAARVGQQDLLLWMVTSFASVVAGQAFNKTRCAILMPESDRAGKFVLGVLASSNREPWVAQRPRQLVIRLGQTLSGYSSLTRLTLTVPETSPPLDRLVTAFALESEDGLDSELSCISIPISIRGDGPSPVLYLWAPPLGGALAAAVSTLQVLAPVVGELVQRGLDTAHTVRSSTDAGMSQFLSRDELQQSLVSTITRLRDQHLNPARQRPADQRLAFIVLTTSAAETQFAPAAKDWLAAQLRFLTPRSFLAPWLNNSEEQKSNRRPIVGDIAESAVMLMIPRPMQKDELDQLRAAIPTRLNDVPFAFTDHNEDMARVSAWVIDEKWNPNLDSVEALVERVLGRATAAASVVEDIIGAYREGVVKGNWHKALAIVKRGLAKDASNPYLLRRAAEFSIYGGGDFEGGEQYARQAVTTGDGLVLSRCLLGDALLGQGRITEARGEYDGAIQSDKMHPLPHHYRGYALLTIAKLLRIGADEMVWAQVFKDAGESQPALPATLETSIGKVQQGISAISADAARSLRRARDLLAHWGTEGLHPIRNFYAIPAAFGLCHTEIIRRNIPGGLQELSAAHGDQPRDEIISRELLLVRMWHAGLAREFVQRCIRTGIDDL